MLEDYDWSVDLRDEFFQRVQNTVLGFMAEAGFDPYFGRRLIAEMASAGLEAVSADGRVRVIRGGSPETAFFRLSLVALQDTLIEDGTIRPTRWSGRWPSSTTQPRSCCRRSWSRPRAASPIDRFAECASAC